ncbi:MAG: CHASE2 domain-containing protein [Alphaproteobacteria bacterium]|nr:CHASE2 domain-containing protein [Alphaproteobacteria bacterium]MBT4085844.1 CHASE2 domain-containing protein [Alphaproteobacteria bacterium]MBT4542683.1 CHASE2 domain-containing protein [Alphaproteobacteria bacterium]
MAANIAPNTLNTGWSGHPLARGLAVEHGRLLAVIVLILVVLAQSVISQSGFNRVGQSLQDFYHRLAPRDVTSLPVVIVDIDEATLKAQGQWPWPRTRLAELIDKVGRQKPLAIGLDIIMPEPDRLSPGRFAREQPGIPAELGRQLATLPSNDNLFAQTIARWPVALGRAALTVKQQSGDLAPVPQTPVQISDSRQLASFPQFADHLTNTREIEKTAFGYGYLNSVLDPDGIMRRVPTVIKVSKQLAPTMGVELIRIALGANWIETMKTADGVDGVRIGDIVLPTDPDGWIDLHFSPADPRRRVSAQKIFQGAIDKSLLENKLVMIGVTGLGVADVYSTPVTPRMDGVEIQAQFIENLLYGTRLAKSPDSGASVLIALLIVASLIIVLGPRFGPGFMTAATVAIVALSLVVGFEFFRLAQQLVDPGFLILGVVLSYLVMMVARIIEDDQDRRLMSFNLLVEREDNARMSGELNAAREIQMGILPDPENIEGLPENLDLHAFLEPAREVGGDLYDLFMLDEHRLFFVIGDVSGKGVPASLFMALSKALCKSAALRTDASVAELMTTANREISRENPAFMFVTAVAGVIDSRTGELEFCNAGHDSPCVVAPGLATKSLNSDGGPPLCVIDDFDYPLDKARLEPGETLVLTTDGVNEAMTASQKMYGTDRLTVCLTRNSDNNAPKNVVATLYDDVKTFVAGAEPNDDITVVAIRFREPVI